MVENRRTCSANAFARVVAVVISVLLSAAPIQAAESANGQNGTSAPLTPQQQAFGQLLDTYATIAGGWFMNQRCKHLTDEKAAEFERNVATLNIYLQGFVKMPFLLTIQKSAKNTAEDKARYPECNSETEKIVLATQKMAGDLSMKIKEAQSYSYQWVTDQFIPVVSFLFSHESCEAISQPLREYADRLVGELRERVDPRMTKEQMSEVDARLAEKGDGACPEDVERQFKASLARAGELFRQTSHW